ncbi:hypothetical protein L484_023562 [Morus notabilis]|uniref:Uncharacterized protein n=1 Tax=Morus notabilis TaxID=981085 RepID=W9R6S7_9ROSA|nr:hypothetical protein L484_023562 [Morus notabilis]
MKKSASVKSSIEESNHGEWSTFPTSVACDLQKASHVNALEERRSPTQGMRKIASAGRG